MEESSPSPTPSKRACGKAHCRGSVALLVPGSVRIKHDASSTVLDEVVEAVVENKKITGHGIMQDDNKQIFASFFISGNLRLLSVISFLKARSD